jgi:hypothetical protein
VPYSFSHVPELTDLDGVRRYLEEELRKISETFNETDALELRASAHAPDKPREGMQIHADGTAWNPGSGAGTYRYQGGAWVKIPGFPIGTADIADNAVTNAKLADMASPRVKARGTAGTGDPEDIAIGNGIVLDATSLRTAQQMSVTVDGSGLKLSGDAGSPGNSKYYGTDSGGTKGFFAVPVSKILQVVSTTYTTNADLTTHIPYDDTIPQSTEGTQVLSTSITPADNTNLVKCKVSVWGAYSKKNDAVTVALFRGTTCIDAHAVEGPVFQAANLTTLGGDTYFNADIIADIGFQICFEFVDSPASASSQTYSVRVGASGSTIRLNGNTAGRKFGGASICTLILEEVDA